MNAIPQIQLDRLRELAEVGASSAAEALGHVLGRSMVSRPVIVRPTSDLFEPERSTAILFEAEGDLAGSVTLLLPEPSRIVVLGLLLRGHGEDAPAETVESALQELGNIVASHTVSSIADALGARILVSVPALVVTADASLTRRIAEHGTGVRFESELFDEEDQVHARLVLVPHAAKPEEP